MFREVFCVIYARYAQCSRREKFNARDFIACVRACVRQIRVVAYIDGRFARGNNLINYFHELRETRQSDRMIPGDIPMFNARFERAISGNVFVEDALVSRRMKQNLCLLA